MLGFPSDLSSSDSLAVILNFAYQSTVLSANPTETNLNGVDALRYSFKPIPKSFIGLNEQNERSLSIVIIILFRALTPIWLSTLSQETLFNLASNSLSLPLLPSLSIIPMLQLQRNLFSIARFITQEKMFQQLLRLLMQSLHLELSTFWLLCLRVWAWLALWYLP